MFSSNTILALIIIAGITYAIAARKLTVIAALTGGVVAYLVFVGAGFTGVAMMTAFFIMGSAATSWQANKKLVFDAANEHKTGRSAAQVLANAGVAGALGLFTLFYHQQHPLLILMMAASFASAAADTLSSELGTVYGKRFFNIISLKPDERGLDGVISLEGTLAGLAGSIIIAVIYAFGFGWDINILWIILAGTAGNLSDSAMGALLERKSYIGNNTVNLLNTLIAALVMLLIYII
ncbi:TIGR00297 family protein [Mucilaginibacter pineti]|uniref:TIGR00297 family protein n=1 Tax=Mucilaginibacter pineti TaxID=1391627 RepID=A0A1G6SWG9_9SPHI|nr:DUF92 domain-containing protein [Mucilaginibacter pineti]SDD20495.1 TIGR00297 family protein [Mucilaginibacter pineti]